MTARELRKKFIQFYESKGHVLFPSGSLVPYDVTGRLDESLLFNGAGMVQFKPYFRGIATPPNRRLVTAQKCVRTGDIEAVGDLTHNTFFEMLGNFSFGDYFKKEAVEFSWEFITSPDWLGLDPWRVAYSIFEADEVAFGAWALHLERVGISPSTRIFRLGEDSNYWPAGAFTNGPPGPCGTNSEMFYWVSDDEPPPGEGYSSADFVRDEAAGKWLEFWNDVFIEFEWRGHLKNPDRPSDGFVKEAIDDLPFQSVDTGMGVERCSAVIGGFKSVYDTDVFTPIIATIEVISAGRVKYSGSLSDRDAAVRVIADHIRTACFCIADGVLPGNTGRGYVLRRLIRRAVLKGQRVLEFRDPFFAQVYEGVVEALGDHYTELIERKAVILETLTNEEALFRRTLNSGYAILEEELQGLKGQTLPGELAFKLYDTFGFPLEVTEELLQERGLTLDQVGYEKAFAEAQERSRTSTERETVYGGAAHTDILWIEPGETPTFVGYDRVESDSKVVLLAQTASSDLEDAEQPVYVGLDQTPFYAESGGQVSDTGYLEIRGEKIPVRHMVKLNGQPLHAISFEPGMEGLTKRSAFVEMLKGASARAVIDASRRRRIIRNHSATHLLHAALRKVLGAHVTQAGSLVAPDHLRFDFTHGKAMTAGEIAEIERIVNEKALEADPVEIRTDVAIADAKKMGAMALFGEKYGERVRVVKMGDFSLELCGGCHVKQTSEIGLFKILSESSAASGIRRIEAVTGTAAYEFSRQDSETLKQAAQMVKSSLDGVPGAVERLMQALKEEKRKVERLRSSSASSGTSETVAVGPVELVTEKLTEGDANEAKLVADRLAGTDPKRVALVALLVDGKVLFVCKAGAAAVGFGVNAGKLVGEVARIAGGGGGGKPEFATAGGKLPEKVDEAMGRAVELLSQQLN